MSASAEPRRAQPPVVAGRVPDFFIAGHAKCGTTALYEMLLAHPRIFMPKLKEPLYFATDLRLRFQRPAAGPLPTELADYLRLFEPAAPEQLIGEASSSYLWSRDAAANIAALAPQAKIIGILREPASFLRSLHLQLLQNHIESEKDLRTALELEPERRQGRKIPPRSTRPQALLYSERVQYVDQLERYERAFPSEQILILIYDDFRADNEATVRRVLRFLELDDSIEVRAREANPTVHMRSQQMDELVHRFSVGRGPASRAVKAAVKALTPQRVRRSALQAARQKFVLGPPRPAEQELMGELRLRFRPEVERLSEHLGRDLVSLWGYDRLD
ncbi:MAG TPA: sulfotransferase [Solirubrobacteraceae bacterium]